MADDVTAPVLQFRAVGRAKPQGSKVGILVGGKNKPRRAMVVDDEKPALTGWREAVRSSAVEAQGPGWCSLTGPLRVVLLFALPRPQKPRWPWPIVKTAGDIDKLTRSTFDALTDAGTWEDDGQVADLRVIKAYPGDHVGQTTPGVVVRVWRIEGGSAPPPSTGQIPLLAQPVSGGTA